MVLEDEDLREEQLVNVRAMVISGFGMQSGAGIFMNECIECLDHEDVMWKNSCSRCRIK